MNNETKPSLSQDGVGSEITCKKCCHFIEALVQMCPEGGTCEANPVLKDGPAEGIDNTPWMDYEDAGKEAYAEERVIVFKAKPTGQKFAAHPEGHYIALTRPVEPAAPVQPVSDKAAVLQVFPKARCFRDPYGKDKGQFIYTIYRGNNKGTLGSERTCLSEHEAWSDARAFLPASQPAAPVVQPMTMFPPLGDRSLHFEDAEVLADVKDSEYAKSNIQHHLMHMTCNEKWSLYRAIVEMSEASQPIPVVVPDGVTEAKLPSLGIKHGTSEPFYTTIPQQQRDKWKKKWAKMDEENCQREHYKHYEWECRKVFEEIEQREAQFLVSLSVQPAPLPSVACDHSKCPHPTTSVCCVCGDFKVKPVPAPLPSDQKEYQRGFDAGVAAEFEATLDGIEAQELSPPGLPVGQKETFEEWRRSPEACAIFAEYAPGFSAPMIKAAKAAWDAAKGQKETK